VLGGNAFALYWGNRHARADGRDLLQRFAVWQPTSAEGGRQDAAITPPKNSYASIRGFANRPPFLLFPDGFYSSIM
jgi:hypothetical protein